MTYQNFKLEYSPASYFENLTLEQKLGATIKGQMRGQYVAQNICDKTIPPELLRSKISETLKSEQSKIHP